MIDKKYLIVAVLATFCLTATLFMIVPTRSQSSSYDPWTDINGDGTIDMADISLAVDGFMASGDATKPVNITGHATKLVKEAMGVTVFAGGSWFGNPILVDGYSKVTINVLMTQTTNQLTLTTYDGLVSFLLEQINNFGNYFVKTYDAPNQYISIYISNTGANSATLYVDVYLVA